MTTRRMPRPQRLLSVYELKNRFEKPGNEDPGSMWKSGFVSEKVSAMDSPSSSCSNCGTCGSTCTCSSDSVRARKGGQAFFPPTEEVSSASWRAKPGNSPKSGSIRNNSACGTSDGDAAHGGNNMLVLPSHKQDPTPTILEADFAQTFGDSFRLPRGESTDELHSKLRRRHCVTQPKAVFTGKQNSASSTANPMHARLKSVFEVEPAKVESQCSKNRLRQPSNVAGQCEAFSAAVEPQSENAISRERKAPTVTAGNEAKNESQAKFQMRLKNTQQAKEHGRQETSKEASSELPVKAMASSELPVKARVSSELQVKLKARLECMEQPVVQQASGPSPEDSKNDVGRKNVGQLQAAFASHDPAALTLVRRKKSTSDLHSKTVVQEAAKGEVICGLQAKLKPIAQARSETTAPASKDGAKSELHTNLRARLKATEPLNKQQPKLEQTERADKSVGGLISFHLPDQEDQATLFSTNSLAGDWWADLSACRFKTYDLTECADDGESAENGTESGYEVFGCESDWWGSTSPPEVSSAIGGELVWDMLTQHVSAEPHKPGQAPKQQSEFQKLQRQVDEAKKQYEAELQKMQKQLEEAQQERKAADAARLQAEAKLIEAQCMTDAAETARQRAEAELLEAQSEAELHKLLLQAEHAEKVSEATATAVALEVDDEDTDDTV